MRQALGARAARGVRILSAQFVRSRGCRSRSSHPAVVFSLRDPHSVLEVEPGADVSAIKSQYRKLALRWHPDVNQDELAEAKFKALREAYELLLGKGNPDLEPNQAPMGGNWDFHDWYWSFSMRQRQARAGESRSQGLGEEHRHKVRSQVSNLKRRAVARHARSAGVVEPFVTNCDDDIECVMHWGGRGAGFEEASEYDDFFVEAPVRSAAPSQAGQLHDTAAPDSSRQESSRGAGCSQRDAVPQDQQTWRQGGDVFRAASPAAAARSLYEDLVERIQAATAAGLASHYRAQDAQAPVGTLSFAGTALHCVGVHQESFAQAAARMGRRLGLSDRQRRAPSSSARSSVQSPGPAAHSVHNRRTETALPFEPLVRAAPSVADVAGAAAPSPHHAASCEGGAHSAAGAQASARAQTPRADCDEGSGASAPRPRFVASDEHRGQIRGQLAGLKRRSALRNKGSRQPENASV